MSGLVFPPTECANSYAWICSHGEVCQSKHDGTLLCSSLLVHFVVNSVCSLRSQDNHLLAELSVYTSIGRRAFSYAATPNLERCTSECSQLTLSQFFQT